MKIKVIGAKKPNVWYANKIGKEYKVHRDTGVFVLDKNHFYKFHKDDCEVIEEEE